MLRFRDRFTPVILIIVIWLRNQLFVAARILESWRIHILLGHREIPIELLDPHVAQQRITKKVFTCMVQVEVRVWVIWILLDVPVGTWRSGSSVWNEVCRRPDNRPR